MKIKTIDNKGIHLTCSDGTIFSIQFGYGNYCSNYQKKNLLDIKNYKHFNAESSDCEVAVINKDGNFITNKFYKDSDLGQVKGYVDIYEAILKAINYEKSYSK